MERILLLEDDKSLVTGLTLALGRAGYALDTARTLAEANRLWQAGRYDLLMLDVTLPDGTVQHYEEDVNERYLREMNYFLDYAAGEETESLNPPATALQVLKLTLGEQQ